MDYDIATVKYAPDGQQEGVVRYDGPAHDEDQGTAIVTDQLGYVYVAGYSTGIGTSWDYITIRYDQDSLGIAQGQIYSPHEFQLYSPFPNPFNASTTIRFQLPVASHVRLQIFDLSGRTAAILVDGWREAGYHEVTWNAAHLALGIYFCRIEAGDFRAVKKMILLK